MKDEAEDWLQDAEEELDTARYLLQGDREKSAAFHLQQSAEKALKALSIIETDSYPWTHDLVKLYKDTKAPAEFYESLRYLNPAYTATRYPDAGSFEARELENRIEDITELIAWIHRQ